MRLYSRKVPFFVPVVLLLAASLVSAGCSPAKMHTTTNSKMNGPSNDELLGGPTKKTVTTKPTELPEPLKPAPQPERRVEPPVDVNPEQPGRVVTQPRQTPVDPVGTSEPGAIVVIPAPNQPSAPVTRRQIVVVDRRSAAPLRPNAPNTIQAPAPQDAKGTVRGPQISSSANTGCGPVVSRGGSKPVTATPAAPSAGCPPVVFKVEPLDNVPVGKKDVPTIIYKPDDTPKVVLTNEIVNTLEIVIVLDDDLLADEEPQGINRNDWKTIQLMGSDGNRFAEVRNYDEQKIIKTSGEFKASRVSEVINKNVPVIAEILKGSENKFKKVRVTIVNDYCEDSRCLGLNGVLTQEFLPEFTKTKHTYFELTMDVINSHLSKAGAIKELAKPISQETFLRTSKQFRGIQTLNDLIGTNTHGLNLHERFGVSINERKKVMFMLVTGATLNYGFDKPQTGFDDFEQSMEFSDQCLFKTPQQTTWKCPSYSLLGNKLLAFKQEVNPHDENAIGLIATRPWNKLTGFDASQLVREGQGFYALSGPISKATASAFNLTADANEFRRSKSNELIKAISEMMK